MDRGMETLWVKHLRAIMSMRSAIRRKNGLAVVKFDNWALKLPLGRQQ